MSIEESVRAVRAPEGSGVRRIGIAMNGVTGRMGMNQHLIRSILAIRAQGGVEVGREVIWPEPGADRARRAQARPARRRRTASSAGAPTSTRASPTRRSTSTSTRSSRSVRPDAIRKAIAAGKHIYCEKPVTETLDEGLELARLARAAGVKNGVVQDKLFLPGLLKLQAS